MTEESRNYSSNELRSGIKLGFNTRILETAKGNKPNLSVHSSYFEFNRVGRWLATWSPDDAIKLIEYLEGWLQRHKVPRPVRIKSDVDYCPYCGYSVIDKTEFPTYLRCFRCNYLWATIRSAEMYEEFKKRQPEEYEAWIKKVKESGGSITEAERS